MTKLRAQAVLSRATKGEEISPKDLARAYQDAPPNAAQAAKEAISAAEQGKSRINQLLEQGGAKPDYPPELADLLGKEAPQYLVSHLENAGSAEKTRRVLGLLPLQVQDDVRRRALQNAIDKSGASYANSELPSGALDPKKVRNLIGTADKRANAEALLGKDGVQFLEDLADYQTYINLAQETSEASKLTSGAAYRGIKEGSVAGAVLGTMGGHPFGGTGVGAALGLAAKAIPRGAQLFLGNAMRVKPVRDYLLTGALPEFSGLTRAATVATPAARAVLQMSDTPNDGNPPALGAAQLRALNAAKNKTARTGALSSPLAR